MIQLLQVINYMIGTLEYTESDVKDIMFQIENGEISWEDLFDCLNLELNPNMIQHLERSESKWDSALHVIKMRRGVL